jgi:hypothetical protein
VEFLTCRKVLQNATGGFTSPSTEVVLRIFIAFKNTIVLAGLTRESWVQFQAR